MKTKFTSLLVGFMVLLFIGLKAKAQEPEPTTDTTSVNIGMMAIGPLSPGGTPIFAVKSGPWNSDIWSSSSGGQVQTNLRPGSKSDVTINASIEVTVNNATSYGGDLNVNGTLKIDNALTMGNSGKVLVSNGGTINVNNTLTVDKNAAITINSGGSVIFNTTGIITDTGQGSGTTLAINSGANITTANQEGFNTGVKNTTIATGSFRITVGNALPVYDAGANYTYNGTAAQNTGSGLPATITGNLTISNPAGVTLTNSSGITVNSPGILKVDGLLKTTANQLISGTGTLTGSGTVHASRISTIPDFLTQYTISSKTLSNLTVDYNGAGNQTISAINYGNLTISNTGTRTVTLPSTGTIGISGTFTPAATNTNYAITGSTVNFNGTGTQVIPNFTFHHLNTSNGGVKTAGSSVIAQGDLSIGSNTTLSAGSALNVAGNFSNAGNFTHNNGTVTLNGTAAQTISGNTTFYNLSLANSGNRDFGSSQITIHNAFIASSGNMNGGTSFFTFTGGNGSIAGTSAKDFYKLQINNGANTSVSEGSLTINNSLIVDGLLNPDATPIISGSGTLQGSGTVAVNRIASLPDFLSQYTITNRDLSNLTVDYKGAGAQTISAINYGHLKISANNSRTITFATPGTIGISKTFSPDLTLTNYTVSGSTIDFNGSAAQDIPNFTFHHLNTSNGGVKTAGSSVTAQGNLSIGSNTTLFAGSALNVAGNFSNAGNFTHNNGTVTLNGTAAQAISDNTTFYNLNLSNSGNRNFGSAQITVGNDFTGDDGNITGSSTFIFTGSTGSIKGAAAKEFHNLQINSGANIAVNGGELTINNSFTNNGTFTQNAGINTFFKNNQTLIGNGNTTFGGLTVQDNTLNAGTHSFTINGGILNTVGNFNGGTATVSFAGNSSITGSGNADFYNLSIASDNFSNTGNKDFNVRGNWTNNGTYTTGTETLTFNGADQTIGGSNSTTFNHLNIAGTATKTMSKDITLKGNLAIENSSTLVAGPNLNVAGNFNNTGSFTHNSGSVNLNGVAQTVSSNTTFYNLNLSGSGSKNFGSSTITIDKAFNADNGSSMAGTSTFIFSGSAGSIGGAAAKEFHNLQINNGANIAINGGGLIINNSFANDGTFNQSEGNTLFKNSQTLTGSGTTTFSGLTVHDNSSLNAGTHNFTVNGGSLSALTAGSFKGGTATVTFTGTSNIGGAGTIDFHNLTIGSGAFSNPNNKSFSLTGNWTNNGTYTAGTETITFNGADQTIGGSNTTTFNSLIAAGTADKNLSNNISVTTSLSLSDKKINTGTNILTADNINRTSGYIVGNLRKSFSSINQGRLFEIGTSLYAPTTINFSSISSPGFLTATTTGAVHSNISSSNINSEQTVKRHWVIKKDTDLAFDNYSIILNYDESENDDTKHAPAYILGKFNPDTWDYPTVSPTPSSTSLTATGLTSFSDFQIGRRKNTKPQLAPIAEKTVEEEMLLTFTASAEDPDPLNKLSFSLQDAPTGASIDQKTGEFTWKPALGKKGTYTFTVRVTNDGNPPMFADQLVTVIVTPKVVVCSLPTPAISISRKDKTFTGLTDNTIALGYGAQKLTLSATGTNLSWSPSQGLSDPNSANPEFIPTQPGKYTFTVTSTIGDCKASNTVIINVVDVKCADKKVMVTHKEGKSNSVLCISVNAVEAHLVQHGDRLGDYQTADFVRQTYNTESQEALSLKSLSPVIEANTKLSAYPNPFTNRSTVKFSVPNIEQRVSLGLYNLNGLKVRNLYEGKAEANLPYSFQLDGTNLSPGVYLIRLVTSKGVETFKTIVTQ